MKKIVEVNHVSKTYGRLNNKTEVLDNISFECLILDYFANRRNRAHRRTRYFKNAR